MLASVLLATGAREDAIAAADRALREIPGWESRDRTPPPLSAANVYLAAGRAHPSVEILERVWSENTMAVDDPDDPARGIDTGARFATLMALEALGAIGHSGPEASRRFEDVHRTWRPPRYSERDAAALRLQTLDYVRLALIHAPDEAERWFAGFAEHGYEVPSLWRAALASWETPPDTAAALAQLVAAIAELDRLPPPGAGPADLYVPIVVAERIGADSIASRLRDEFRTCGGRIDNFDPFWGMRTSLGVEP